MARLYKILYNTEDHWLSTLASQLNVDIHENKIHLPKDLADGFLIQFEIEDGIQVSFGEMLLKSRFEYIIEPCKHKSWFTILFNYIERGRSIFRPVDGEYKEVNSGGVHFFSSDVYNHLIFPENTHSFFFMVEANMKWMKENLTDFVSQDKSFYDMIYGNDKIMHFEPLTNRFLRLFSDVFKSEFDQKLNHLIVKDKGYEAVVLFFDHFYKKFFKENINYSKYTIDDQKRLYGLVDFVKDNLSQDLTLDQLARRVGFSKSKLQAMFHHFFHQSIYAFIKSLRMEQAVELLKSTNLDIRMIAHQLGYNSSTHFINIFKKHYGLSPKKFKMEKLSKR